MENMALMIGALVGWMMTLNWVAGKMFHDTQNDQIFEQILGVPCPDPMLFGASVLIYWYMYFILCYTIIGDKLSRI